MWKRLFWSLLAVLALTATLGAQDLSNQVLQLLTRVNTWTATNTFYDLRVAPQAIPSVTTNRIYADFSGNLYFNGGLIAGAGGGVTPHNILSSTHADTVADTVVRGDVIVGNSTPKWARLALCASGSYLGSDGTDTKCLTSAAGFTAIPGAQITGTIAAVSGVNLTNLNASNLASGTVPLARLSGITTSQISGTAAITRSQLSIASGIVLTTDVTGTLPRANGGTGVTVSADDTVLVGSGSAWAPQTLPDCAAATSALNYTQSTNAFSCRTISVGTGTVTSVAMTVPTGFAISGTPVTTTGTLALTLSTQTANTVWSGPTTGAAAAPTFRALVNADFPLTGVAAGTYPKVTVNTRGLVTAAATQIDLTTDVTGTLPVANGGLGITTATNNTVPVGNGTGFALQTLPNCTTGLLAFTTASSLFSCPTTLSATGGVTSASPSLGVGYATGAGGTVTQITSKATGVTVNAVTGAITTHAANLGATTTVGFTVTNSSVAATDVVVVNLKSGGTVDSYTITVDTVAAGSFRISIRNYTGGGLAETLVLNFAVIKGVTS